FARDYASFLMEQSEGLLQYGELKDAERMAQQAKNLKVRFGAGERNPDQLLEHIAGLQSQASARPQVNQFAAPAAGGSPQRLPTVEFSNAPSPQKQQAMQLMANASLALERNDVATAHRLAEQAHQLRVPESEFAQGEKRPWELVLE